MGSIPTIGSSLRFSGRVFCVNYCAFSKKKYKTYVTLARRKNQLVEHPFPLPKKRKKNVWPNVYTRTHPTGSKSWVVDLGEINGKRDRHSFKTKQEAETFAEQARVKKQNEGLAAFNLPNEIRADALRASEERYRTLFESIDEGFCIIEKVEGGTAGPLDFRYIVANPAFEMQSGVGGVVGKTIRQAFWYGGFQRIYT